MPDPWSPPRRTRALAPACPKTPRRPKKRGRRGPTHAYRKDTLFRELAERLATAGVTKYYEVETRRQELPPVTCDTGMIEQALTNVILNAAHAMGEVGVLRLSTRNGSGELARQVEDTGPGIPEETLDQLFKPFFTKKGNQGTGLGLYVTRQIVEAHGGRVGVNSRPEHGSWAASVYNGITGTQATPSNGCGTDFIGHF